MPAQNGQLARVLCPVGCCFHQNSLYQLHALKTAGYVASMSSFAGNTCKRRGLASDGGGESARPPVTVQSALAVICVAQFVVVLDATIVTTALPAIRQTLGFTDAGLQWVFTAYALV